MHARRVGGAWRVLAAAFVCFFLGTASAVWAADTPQENDSAQVLQPFTKEAPAAPRVDSGDLTRRWVMFGLGAPLLLLILATAALGIAMGVYGKPVYVAHMVCAGLSVTLAIVHAIVGLVWFRPF